MLPMFKINLFKSQEAKDFDRAMDFLECSRTLMSCAIEAHRAIEEYSNGDFAELLQLIAAVKPADDFLKKNLNVIDGGFNDWCIKLSDANQQRYQKIERMINNTSKNFITAREKALQIDHWVSSDLKAELSVLNLFA